MEPRGIKIAAADEPPDYMNERVFQRNRLQPRAYFLPATNQCLSGKWKFHYNKTSPHEPAPSSADSDAWSLIDVPGMQAPLAVSPSANLFFRPLAVARVRPSSLHQLQLPLSRETSLRSVGESNRYIRDNVLHSSTLDRPGRL